MTCPACERENCTCEYKDLNIDVRDMQRAYPAPSGGRGLKRIFYEHSALKADAERLAYLRREFLELWPADTARSDINAVRLSDREKTLRTLIAVYEECAARGRTFGGGS